MDLKYIVYITVNQINGKFYFGVHETNPNTWDGYIGDGVYRVSNANSNSAFHRAVRKYGYENFKRTTLKIFPHTEQGEIDAYKFESELVNETLLKSKTCYNTRLGGRGGGNFDQMKRVYMFDLNGNYLRSFKCARDAARYILSGNEQSARATIKNNCLGKTQSAFGYFWSYFKKFSYKINSIRIAQYTLNGKFLRTFSSQSEAEALLQISTIQQALKTGCSAGGYQWKYYFGNEENIPRYISIANKNKCFPILMLDLNDKLIAEYKNVNECVKQNSELTASQINRVLKNIIKSHKGYHFKYKDEDIVSLN